MLCEDLKLLVKHDYKKISQNFLFCFCNLTEKVWENDKLWEIAYLEKFSYFCFTLDPSLLACRRGVTGGGSLKVKDFHVSSQVVKRLLYIISFQKFFYKYDTWCRCNITNANVRKSSGYHCSKDILVKVCVRNHQLKPLGNYICIRLLDKD